MWMKKISENVLMIGVTESGSIALDFVGDELQAHADRLLWQVKHLVAKAIKFADRNTEDILDASKLCSHFSQS